MNYMTWLVTITAMTQTPAPTFFPFFEPIQPPRSLQIMAHRGALGLRLRIPGPPSKPRSPTPSNGSKSTSC